MLKLVMTPTSDDAHTAPIEVSAATYLEVAAALLLELEQKFSLSAYEGAPAEILEGLAAIAIAINNGEPTVYNSFEMSAPDDAFTLELTA